MKDINVVPKFAKQIKHLYKIAGKVNGLTHSDLKLGLQRNWSIRTASAFVNQFGLRYDYAKKKWIQNKHFVKIDKQKAAWKKQRLEESVSDPWNRSDLFI